MSINISTIGIKLAIAKVFALTLTPHNSLEAQIKHFL